MGQRRVVGAEEVAHLGKLEAGEVGNGEARIGAADIGHYGFGRGSVA